MAKATYHVTNALKAVGESDWATRPGFGTAASVSGHALEDADGLHADVRERRSSRVPRRRSA